MKQLIVLLLLMAAYGSGFAQKSDSTANKKNNSAVTSYVCSMHPEVSVMHPGTCAKCGSYLVVNRVGSKQVSKEYYCGMHPEVVSNEAGTCPICKMELLETKPKVKTKKS